MGESPRSLSSRPTPDAWDNRRASHTAPFPAIECTPDTAANLLQLKPGRDRTPVSSELAAIGHALWLEFGKPEIEQALTSQGSFPTKSSRGNGSIT